jgi:hypothetical protein
MPSLAFTFQTTTSEKIIQLDLVSGVINVNVIDGDLEYQPSFSELSNYITLASDPYYTEGLFYISDFSICYEFNGFSNLGALNLGSYSIELNHNTMGQLTVSAIQVLLILSFSSLEMVIARVFILHLIFIF